MFLIDEGRDYTTIDEELIYSPSKTRIIVNVSITDDSIVEGMEHFSLRLYLIHGQTNVRWSNDSAIVSILDDDGNGIYTSSQF